MISGFIIFPKISLEQETLDLCETDASQLIMYYPIKYAEWNSLKISRKAEASFLQLLHCYIQ